MLKRAIIFTWNGFQDQEVIYPYYRLLEDKFEVTIASENASDIFGIFGIKFQSTYSVNKVETGYFDFLVLPGGVKALEKLRQQQKALDFISQWNKEGKIIASTCHGAQMLISAKVVTGRTISGYYSIKDDIINAGAIYSDAGCVIDGNIISSPHYKHMGEWMHGALTEYYKKNS
jgi:protease I